MSDDDEYYNEQDITVLVKYRIKWNREDPRARQDAIKFATCLPVRGGGAGPYGCYGAEQLEISIDE